MDGLAMMTSTLPGMVIGVGFLFAFSGTILQNTIAILILANLVHFFAGDGSALTHECRMGDDGTADG